MTIREIIVEFEEYRNRVHIVLIPTPALTMYSRLKELEKESRAKLKILDPDRMWWKAVELFNEILGPEVSK